MRNCKWSLQTFCYLAEIAEYFGTIGIIKTDKKTKGPKIWLYRDKVSGSLKGDGTVRCVSERVPAAVAAGLAAHTHAAKLLIAEFP